MKPGYRLRPSRLENPVKPDIEMPRMDRIRYEFKQRDLQELTGTRLFEAHPLAPLSGKYNNEPLWDDFMQAIREYRESLNEQDDEEVSAE